MTVAAKKSPVAPPPETATEILRLVVGYTDDGAAVLFGKAGWSDEDMRDVVLDWDGHRNGYFVELELPKPKTLVLKAKVVG